MQHPEPGLVIPYVFLWRSADVHDSAVPCVVVTAQPGTADGSTHVQVVPIARTVPGAVSRTIKLCTAVARHLGIGYGSAWIVLDEINEFEWPDRYLRPVPGKLDSIAYGFLPPRLFRQLTEGMQRAWREDQGKNAPPVQAAVAAPSPREAPSPDS